MQLCTNFEMNWEKLEFDIGLIGNFIPSYLMNNQYIYDIIQK